MSYRYHRITRAPNAAAPPASPPPQQFFDDLERVIHAAQGLLLGQQGYYALQTSEREDNNVTLDLITPCATYSWGIPQQQYATRTDVLCVEIQRRLDELGWRESPSETDMLKNDGHTYRHR